MQANQLNWLIIQSLCTLSLFIASSYSDPFLINLTSQRQSLAKLVPVDFNPSLLPTSCSHNSGTRCWNSRYKRETRNESM
jgi:hypothetical protein